MHADPHRLATALGVAAVKACKGGCDPGRLFEALRQVEREDRLSEKIRFYARASLLIVDDTGKLLITTRGGNLFLQLISPIAPRFRSTPWRRLQPRNESWRNVAASSDRLANADHGSCSPALSE